jgi:hypothetical protein
MGSDQDASRQTQCKVDVMRTPQHEHLFVTFWRPIANGHRFVSYTVLCALKIPVGASLLAKAESQAASMLIDPPLSRASPLPHGVLVQPSKRIGVPAAQALMSSIICEKNSR